MASGNFSESRIQAERALEELLREDFSSHDGRSEAEKIFDEFLQEGFDPREGGRVLREFVKREIESKNITDFQSAERVWQEILKEGRLPKAPPAPKRSEAKNNPGVFISKPIQRSQEIDFDHSYDNVIIGGMAKEFLENNPEEAEKMEKEVQTRKFVTFGADSDVARTWIFNVHPSNPYRFDVDIFKVKYKKEFKDVVLKELFLKKSAKISFRIVFRLVKMATPAEEMKTILSNRPEMINMDYFFADEENQPKIYYEETAENTFEEHYEECFENLKKEIEKNEKKGSGWIFNGIMRCYIEVAFYEALKGSSYFELPKWIRDKKAVINVKNDDQECLKWALRSALSPVNKSPQRVSKYKEKDGLDYRGISFPRPVNEIDKLEKNNPRLSINVFTYEEGKTGSITPCRNTKNPKGYFKINLLFAKSGEKTHYCWIKNFKALMHDNQTNQRPFYCMKCLARYSNKVRMEKHEKECKGVDGKEGVVRMPEEGQNKLKFKNFKNLTKAPFVIYADAEAVLEKTEAKDCEGNTVKKAKHTMSSFAFIAVRSDGEVAAEELFRGKEAPKVLIEKLEETAKKPKCDLKEERKFKKMSSADWESFYSETKCSVCDKDLVRKGYEDWKRVYDPEKAKYCGKSHERCLKEALQEMGKKQLFHKEVVFDKTDKWIDKNQTECLFCGESFFRAGWGRHATKMFCQFSGKFEGVAHQSCKRAQNINPGKLEIPIVFHNLSGYDAHFVMEGLAQKTSEEEIPEKIEVIAKSSEKYTTIKHGNLKFIDSLNFLGRGLESLVKTTEKKDLPKTAKLDEGKGLLFRKGVFPYEYIDSWRKYEDQNLSPKEAFYDALHKKEIKDSEHEYAKEVWEEFGCKTLGDYSDLYLKTDVALLADIFENFRKLCIKIYGLDPLNYPTAPSFAWDALLQKTKVELELLTDIDMI